MLHFVIMSFSLGDIHTHTVQTQTVSSMPGLAAALELHRLVYIYIVSPIQELEWLAVTLDGIVNEIRMYCTLIMNTSLYTTN